MGDFDSDVDDVLEQLEGLARRVPEAVPKAVNAMANVLIKKLRNATPKETGELAKAIGKTSKRKSRNGNSYRVVFIKDCGENDRNVHKVLALEYGSSRQDADPFWNKTVRASQDEMYEAAKGVMEKAIYGK